MEVRLKVYFSFRTKIDTDGKSSVKVPDGATVSEALEVISSRFPGFQDRVLNENGQPKRFVQIKVNRRNVNRLNGLSTELKKDDEIIILPKLGGG